MPPPSKRARAPQTPLRDDLRLNADTVDNAWERASIRSVAEASASKSISTLLQSLPQPKHQYEITADQVMQMEEEIERQEQAFWEQEHQR